MMQEFSNYLKEQGVTSDDKLFEGKTKEYTKEWMMQKQVKTNQILLQIYLNYMQVYTLI